jgi:hypothetical protein
MLLMRLSMSQLPSAAGGVLEQSQQPPRFVGTVASQDILERIELFRDLSSLEPCQLLCRTLLVHSPLEVCDDEIAAVDSR